MTEIINLDDRMRATVVERIRAGVRRRLARFTTKWMVRQCGSKSLIAPPRHVWGGRYIRLGDKVTIHREARIEAFRPSHGGVSLTVGDGSIIHPGVHIGALRDVSIGRSVLIAANCYVTDHDHDWTDPWSPPIENRRLLVSPTRIGDYTWLGERVMVLKGVTIGERSIIGAGSIVTKDIPAFSVAVGAPARVIRTWDDAEKQWVGVEKNGS